MSSTSLAPRASATFTVAFSPAANGARSAALHLASNDVDEASFDITLSGTGGPSNNPDLSALALSSGELSPAFAAATTGYSVTLPGTAGRLTVTPTASSAGASIQVNGGVVASGAASAAISPATGTNTITVRVTAADGVTTKTYTVTLVGQPRIALEQPLGTPLLGARNLVGWGGIGMAAPVVPTPVTNALAADGSDYHSLVLFNDGTISALGGPGYGLYPAPTLSGVQAIACGPYHHLALLSNGSVSAWGEQSGDGSPVTMPAGLTGVKSIAAGVWFSVAAKTDGTVTAWGWPNNWRQYGQLNVPAGLSNVTAVAAGMDHALALKNDGSVVAWGRGSEGQTSVPAGLPPAQAIAAGSSHSLALLNDGTVVGWGNTSVPADLTGVTAIAAGTLHSLALKSDGTVVAWGRWNGTTSGASYLPTAVPTAGTLLAGKSPRSVACGSANTIVICTDGTLAGWGGAGGIGDGSGVNQLSPVAVNTGILAASEKFSGIFPGGFAAHHIASVARPYVLTGRSAFDASLAASGLSGANAEPLATPFSDGVPNLLKYAFNMPLTKPNAGTLTPGSGGSGLPVFSKPSPGVFRVEFLRRRNSGLDYTPQRSSSLGAYSPMTGTPVVTVIDAEWERVVIEEPRGSPAPSLLFSRVAVTLP